MVQVKIDMVPQGNESKRFSLGVVDIARTTGNAPNEPNDYDVSFRATDSGLVVKTRIIGHPHDDGFLRLVQQALQQVVLTNNIAGTK